MMRKLIAVAIGSATLLLALSFALTARWSWVAAVVGAGLLWLAGSRYGPSWVSTLALLFFVTLAVLGVILRFHPLWLLSSLGVALVAWDLEHFSRYLSDVADVRDEAGLIKSHLRRLGVVALLGWCLGVAALSVRFTFDFIPTLALGLLVIVALSRAIRYVRRTSGGR